MIILAKETNPINMLLDKDIKKIQELKTDYTPSWVSAETIFSRFKALKLSESLSAFQSFKIRGFDFKSVLAVMVCMVVSPEKTVHSYLNSATGEGSVMGKDVFYRMKNSPSACWRMLLWHLVMRFLKVTSQDEAGTETTTRYLIFDDTTLPKTGKCLEKIGRVWDHVTNSYVLGFKLLVMMYWDGKSAIPLDFSLHREKGKKEERPYGMSKKELRSQFSKKRVKDSYSAKRVDDLDSDKIKMVLRMFYSAIYRDIKVDYVLVDSWFTCDALIQAIRGIKEQTVHLIGMYKFAKTRFEFQGKMMTHAEINNALGNPKRCRSLRYQYKQAKVIYQGVEISLFFSRQGNGGKWKVILTTDTSLSFTKLLEKYQVRWSVEVFFREAKQLLNLGGCQSNNFDAQIAETTISMIAYLLLTLRYRYEHYESMGALYRSMNAEVLNQTLDIRLWGLFQELVRTVAEVLEMDADELLKRMLTNQKAEVMISALLMSCNPNDDWPNG